MSIVTVNKLTIFILTNIRNTLGGATIITYHPDGKTYAYRSIFYISK